MVEQLTYTEALEGLRGAYEREKIQLTAQISTLQLSVNQQSHRLDYQTIKIKSLETKLAAKEQDCYA